MANSFSNRLLASVVACWILCWTSAFAADLRIALSADVTTMDPHGPLLQSNVVVHKHIFDALTRFDGHGRIIPGLAESWSNPDSLTWDLKLRRGVRFHDGSEFTAEDVVYSLERPLKLKELSGFASNVRVIAAKQVLDPHTIRLITSVPYGALLEDLAVVLIVSKDFDSGKTAVGTGPFRLVKYAPGDRVQLARHPEYWAGAPPWDNVTLRIISAAPVRTAALLSDDVDAIENVSPADLPRLTKDTRFRFARAVSWRTIFLHLDQYRDVPPGVTDKSGKPLASNPFKDLRVRQALSKAINREALVKQVMEGLAVPAGNIASPTVVGHEPAVKPDAYDPEGARRLLAEAGYPSGFQVSLATPNNRYVNDEQVALACAQMWSRIGVTTKVEAMPMAAYVPKARKYEFGAALLGWGYPAADLSLKQLAATPSQERGYGAWNWGRYSNPHLDKLIEQSLQTTSPAQRETAARAASTVAARDLAFIPLHYQIVTWAMKQSLDYAARTDEFTLAHFFKPR